LFFLQKLSPKELQKGMAILHGFVLKVQIYNRVNVIFFLKSLLWNDDTYRLIN
jgi:hypothetical protein